MIRSFFGDRAFYKKVMLLTLPIMIQNGITNFVNMLDNLMIGQVGTAEMSGVSIANQLIFVFNLTIFGAISGAGIFGAQFHGKGDTEGLRYSFRFKIIFCSLITILGMVLFYFFASQLISLYLTGDGSAEEIAASLKWGKEYLLIMMIGFLPFTATQSFASTLRETGKATPPMVAGLIAVGVNLILNYILIFGNFGAPKLGVHGAAIATVVSRFVELFCLTFWTFKNKHKNKFIIGAFSSVYIPIGLIRKITVKGLPLMVNEFLWSGGMAVLNQCYSMRGYNVVPATNISSTFFNVFSVAFLSLGGAIAIITGQQLGAGDTKNVMSTAKKLITFSVLVGTAVGIVYAFAAFLIPYLYNVSDEVRGMSTSFMQLTAFIMPFDAFVTASYFIMRSGGKTIITFLFDSGCMWGISILSAFLLVNFTTLPIVPLFGIVQLAYVIKAILGFFIVRRGKWIQNIVAEN